ncbi:MAG: ABC transporter substrate-binding protein [Gammaproteobacteria bacterium]
MRSMHAWRPLRATVAGLAGLLWLAAGTIGVAAAADAVALDIRIAFVGTPDTPAHRGALQGLEEARAQGEFLGQRYTLEVTSDPAAIPPDVAAIVVAADSTTLTTLAQRSPAVPVLNVSHTDDALRRACEPTVFHVLPSDAMLGAAEAQWRQANPTATGVQARAWHPDFEKYAAAQLNRRYRKAFGDAMNDQAWAGWAAVKLLSDTVAREQTAAPATLLDALRTRLTFDGQKGVDMSFRVDGQLRQPLLLVADDRIIGEAPVRGVADVEDLDSLGQALCTP